MPDRMAAERIEAVVRALLYEGSNLYPYRPSALKNRQRWTFGTLYPPSFVTAAEAGDASMCRTECLVRGAAGTTVETAVRFLQPVAVIRDGQTWEDSIERRVDTPVRALVDLVAAPDVTPFAIAAGETADPRRRRWLALDGTIERRAERVDDGVFRIAIVVRNLTAITTDTSADARAARAAARLAALAATHTVLHARDGEFVSLLDPPPALRAAAAACANVGTWPVLVGARGDRRTLLSAPIVLYDYPEIAPESPGDFFDATEIDELLTLRVLTLTEDERRAMQDGDERTRAVLARTEALDADALLRLHGAVRERSAAGSLRPGARVRLCPRGRADVMDLALAGRVATIVGVEEDYEGRRYVAVTVDDDPGRDLGARGSIGHRFYFAPDEVEPLP